MKEDDQAMVSSPQNNLNIQIKHLPIKPVCDSIAALHISIIFLGKYPTKQFEHTDKTFTH